MKRLSFEPVRLIHLGVKDDPANVAGLVRSAIRTPKDVVPKLKGRIRHSLRTKATARRRRLRVAILAAIVFLSGGVVGAVTQPMVQLWQRHRAKSAASPERLPAQRSPLRRQVSSRPAPPTEEVALVAPEPATPAPSPAVPAIQALADETTRSTAASVPRAVPVVARPSRNAITELARERPASVPVTLDPPPFPSPITPSIAPSIAPSRLDQRPSLAQPAPSSGVPEPVVASSPTEQVLLTRAIRSLRAEHHPATALAALDEYLQRFPNGNLRPEASRLRAEAFLALGQKPAALAELTQSPASGAPGGEESHLVRGELRAAAGRWREAVQDFDLVVRARLAEEAALGAATTDKRRERLERALWDRASARSHLGDAAGARADLRECLRRFPTGRFAAQVMELLGERH